MHFGISIQKLLATSWVRILSSAEFTAPLLVVLPLIWSSLFTLY